MTIPFMKSYSLDIVYPVFPPFIRSIIAKFPSEISKEQKIQYRNTNQEIH